MKKPFGLHDALLKMLALVLVFAFTGCDDDDCPTQQCPTPQATNYALVLNEGNFQTNNSSLTYYDMSCFISTQNYFEQRLGRLLGDTSNDMILVDNMLYIVVNNSHKLEVVDTKTWTSVKNISLQKDDAGADPREIVEYNGKLFVSCYVKKETKGYVAVIDTANNYGNAITWLEVGDSPEALVVVEGKIYVANSNYDFSAYASSVGSISIIDGSSLTVETISNVGYNISGIAADAYGDLYVVSKGNYSDIPANLYVFNSTAKAVTDTFNITAQQVRIVGDEAYVSVGGYDENWAFVANIVKIDVTTETIINNDFIGSSNFQTFYGFDIEPNSGDVYCLDARDHSVSGDALIFDKNGQKKAVFATGINPCKILFLDN